MSEYEFGPDDLRMLQHLSEKVAATATWAGRRLVVEVWDLGDRGPIAWVEYYPEDSDAVIRFDATRPDDAPGATA